MGLHVALALSVLYSLSFFTPSTAHAEDDRSDELSLRWVTDDDPSEPVSDEFIFLELRNTGPYDIELPREALWRIHRTFTRPDGKLWSPGGCGCGGSGGSARPFLLQSGRAVFIAIDRPSPAVGVEIGDVWRWNASFNVTPDTFVESDGNGPNPPGRMRRPDRRVGFAATVRASELRVAMRPREPVDAATLRPVIRWRNDIDRLRWLSTSELRELRACASRNGGMDESVSDIEFGGIPRIEREWMEALGADSRIPEADDHAFDLASMTVLHRCPELRRRWLQWVASTHAGRTGGIRAAELLRWIEAGATRELLGFISAS